ncbi:MAG: 16S rRNA (adenine(1518)-N(6)/adenine(1519)-N(6))-dimethyltransferase RsmA [Bacteroidetes bacterium]|nr:16S rRNA (adenine(1518)-N(6)/adenine(1519)-N(6))-dimethyltransferase RsmA [Bacteroidota bacterium]
MVIKLKTHRHKKFLGQHFLQDKNISRKIAESLLLTEKDFVVEIGPGKGILTRELLKHIPHLTAIEFDGDLIDPLKSEFGNSLTLINDDFLNVDLNILAKKNKIKLVGNIPYNITSQIIFKAIDSNSVVSELLIMIQKEVAERIVAKPNSKAYGILSVLIQYFGDVKILFNVSPGCFYPKPKVTSSVIKIDFKKRNYLLSCDELLFRKIVRGTFNMRRKTLRNTLRSLKFSEDKLSSLDLDLNRRAESLSIKEFLDLTNQLSNK